MLFKWNFAVILAFPRVDWLVFISAAWLTSRLSAFIISIACVRCLNSDSCSKVLYWTIRYTTCFVDDIWTETVSFLWIQGCDSMLERICCDVLMPLTNEQSCSWLIISFYPAESDFLQVSRSVGVTPHRLNVRTK